MTISGLRHTKKSYAKLGVTNVGGSHMARAMQDLGLILQNNNKPKKASITYSPDYKHSNTEPHIKKIQL
jgi:hypothetical protein